MSTAAAKRLPLPTRAVVATCNLNQWALDFDGNLQRVKRSIVEAKAQGARYRVGPELELTGYSCEDHFLEQDTYLHSDQSLADILSGDLTDGILCDIGLPVLHNNVRYNCRAYCLNRKIILIRPKMFLADDGNYRENRFFTAWKSFERLEEHQLSDIVADATGQTTVPFGFAMIRTADAVIASETCEELWTPRPPHIEQALAGVDIIGNGSGSYHQLRKLDTRIDLMRDATRKCGGVYLYSNQQGCDGQRTYFDGSSMICMNGQILCQASQFSVRDVEVIAAVIDLQDIKSYRGASSSFQLQASMPNAIPSLHVPEFRVCVDIEHPIVYPTPPIQLRYHTPDEECLLGPACWLWDYLRRSGASGYFLPLSGGADSTSVAAIVYCMCTMVLNTIREGDEQVKADVLRITNRTDVPDTPQELCNYILHTSYMGTENSSHQTRDRAQRLADAIGAHHTYVTVDAVVAAVVGVFVLAFGKTPAYTSAGGTVSEDMALQNIQARVRMVIAYLFAQLLPWVRGRKGFLLVLGSANIDEALRGYMTKYDCSSADINPIGGMSKKSLLRMLMWAANKFDMPVLSEVAAARPTAELRPISGGAENAEHSQSDEADMGMTYEELSWYGFFRKVHRCGPVSLFERLCVQWKNLAPAEVAAKVKKFMFYYSINRHKMTTLTPAYHAEQYSPDDNRYDLRPFLYNSQWERQFDTMDAIVAAELAADSDGNPTGSSSHK